jgi:hypothetical protein
MGSRAKIVISKPNPKAKIKANKKNKDLERELNFSNIGRLPAIRL